MLKLSAAAIAAAVLTVALAAPAEAAAKRKKHYVYGPTYQQRVAMANGPRSRITVRKRSYLDAGTEVLPGERKFNDYAIPLGYLSTSPIDPYRPGDIQTNTGFGYGYTGFRPGIAF